MKTIPVSKAHEGLSNVRSIKGAEISPKNISAIIAFAKANDIKELTVSSANGFSKSIVQFKRMTKHNCNCVFFCGGKIVNNNVALEPSYKHFIAAYMTGSTMALFGYFPGEVRS